MAQPQLRPIVRCLRRLATRTGPVGNATDHQLLAQFVAGDTAAFEMLVQRHGGMVWEVCRRRLAQDADADDACQAVFLVLAQKADSIRKRHSLAAWLHGVAYRVAEDAKRQAAGRRRREQTPRPTRAAPDPLQEATWREVSQVLDAELRQLAEAYRAPLVLCYLEGQTREQAATQLGWSLRTVERRLERGRALLRGRLERRGLGLSAVLLAGGLAPKAMASPDRLLPMVQMACAGSMGTSARVLSLAEIAVKAMAAAHGHWALAALLAVSVLTAGASLVARQSLSLHPPKQAATAAPPFSEAKHATPQPVRVDRYGDPLPKGALMRLGTLRFCQPWASSLHFSPDGKLLVSGGADRCIRLWNPETGKDVRVLEGHHNAVNCIDQSADGKWLASGSQDGGLYLWDIDSGTIRRRFRSRDTYVGPVALSPNGRVLASSGSSGTLRLWDTHTGQQMRSVPSPDGFRVESVTFSPDSKYVAFNNRPDNPIQLVEVATGKVIRRFSGHKDHVLGLVFAPDGKTLISGGVDGTIRAWDVATGTERCRFGDGKEYVSCLALGPDGKTLAYATYPSGLVHLLDLATNRDRARPWKASQPCVNSIAYSPDGTRVAATTSDGIVILDAATGRRLDSSPESRSLVQQVAYATDGQVLAVRRLDQTIELWDTLSWRKTATIRLALGGFTSMTFSPDGNYLTTAETQPSPRSVICQRDPHTGRPRTRFAASEDWLESLSYSADGKTLAGNLSSGNRQVFIRWDPLTGKEQGRITGPISAQFGLQLSPAGRLFACRTAYHTVTLCDARTGRAVQKCGRPSSAVDLFLFSPDGRSIAAPDGSAKDCGVTVEPDIVLWETATGQPRLRLAVGEGQVGRLAFARNGRLLASAAGNETINPTIHLWDSWSGQELGRLLGHRGRVSSLSFSPDGKTLASGGHDTTVLVWDVSRFYPAAQPQGQGVPRDELLRCWQELAGTDAARAYRAMWTLSRGSGATERLLSDELAANSPLDAAHVRQLIVKLDSRSFKVREHASKELARLGKLAERALRETLEHKPSAEVRWRIEQLLTKLSREVDAPEHRRLLRVTEVLERLGTPSARHLLNRLAKGATDPDVQREARASLARLGRRTLTR